MGYLWQLIEPESDALMTSIVDLVGTTPFELSEKKE